MNFANSVRDPRFREERIQMVNDYRNWVGDALRVCADYLATGRPWELGRHYFAWPV